MNCYVNNFLFCPKKFVKWKGVCLTMSCVPYDVVCSFDRHRDMGSDRIGSRTGVGCRGRDDPGPVGT